MNIYGTTKIEYIEFLLKKGVLTLKDIEGDAWNMGTPRSEPRTWPYSVSGSTPHSDLLAPG